MEFARKNRSISREHEQRTPDRVSLMIFSSTLKPSEVIEYMLKFGPGNPFSQEAIWP
jgi:hypothetical protein